MNKCIYNVCKPGENFTLEAVNNSRAFTCLHAILYSVLGKPRGLCGILGTWDCNGTHV